MLKVIKESVRMFFAPITWTKKFLYHTYFAVRYGDWDMGWDKEWLTKTDHEWFYCGHIYYDGDHAAIRIGKFYVGVSY